MKNLTDGILFKLFGSRNWILAAGLMEYKY